MFVYFQNMAHLAHVSSNRNYFAVPGHPVTWTGPGPDRVDFLTQVWQSGPENQAIINEVCEEVLDAEQFPNPAPNPRTGQQTNAKTLPDRFVYVTVGNGRGQVSVRAAQYMFEPNQRQEAGTGRELIQLGTRLEVRIHATLLGNSYPEDPATGIRDTTAPIVQGNRHLTLEVRIED